MRSKHLLGIVLIPASLIVARGPARADGTANVVAAYKDALDRTNLSDKEQLKAQSPHNIYEGDTAILFFDEKANPLFLPFPQLDEDDTIQFVFVAAGETLKSASVGKCTAARALRVGGSLAGLPGAFNPAARSAAPAGTTSVYAVAQRCSADTATEVTVTGDAAYTATIQTVALYRLTIGVGFIFDHTPITQFRAANLQGESVPVVVEDTHEAGLAAVAMITLHAFKTDFDRSRFDFSRGRTIGLLLLNPTIGISLSAPADHLYLADNIVLYPGLGIVLGYHFYRKPTLANGLQVGDRLSGGVDVPVDQRWFSDKGNWFVGVNVGTAILAQLLGALNR